jgi:hypothetical protein
VSKLYHVTTWPKVRPPHHSALGFSHDRACYAMLLSVVLSSTHAGATFVHAGNRLQTVHGGERPQRAKQKEQPWSPWPHTTTQEAPERHTFPNGNHNHTPPIGSLTRHYFTHRMRSDRQARTQERAGERWCGGWRSCVHAELVRASSMWRSKVGGPCDKTLHAATGSTHSPLLLCRR